MTLLLWKTSVMKMKSINRQHYQLQLSFRMRVLLTLMDCFETLFRMHQSNYSLTTIDKDHQEINTRKEQVRHMTTGCSRQSNLISSSLS
jgi:hypothetical protein